ncbi:hypothetical protein KY310_03820 [Candidatus Woesearchaeota archaeon]|nr:hypothetical protein [Candidatus Woesearchaeota archaeon]
MGEIHGIKRVLPRKVPEGYRLGVDGWFFSQERLNERLEDGTRKLLTLDISISPDEFAREVNKAPKEELASKVEELYRTICPRNCSGCFEKGNIENFLLTFDEVKQYLEQAIELGLEFVKFLGPGELIANPDLFKILDYFKENNIKIGIFTKGATDQLAAQHGLSFEEFIKNICDYDNVRVLADYRAHRTIKALVQNGMNADLFRQRMSLQTNPVTAANIDEILAVFKWGTERNIPVCVTPTMVSGRGRKLIDEAQTKGFQAKLVKLYSDIYKYLINRAVMTREQLEREGVSAYAGTAPCNQLSCGMFIRKDGVVQACPGNDGEEFIIAEDVRKEPLKDIWVNSRNYALGPVFNNKCVKDGITIPYELYQEVSKRVRLEVRRMPKIPRAR